MGASDPHCLKSSKVTRQEDSKLSEIASHVVEFKYFFERFNKTKKPHTLFTQALFSSFSCLYCLSSKKSMIDMKIAEPYNQRSILSLSLSLSQLNKKNHSRSMSKSSSSIF